jgi:2-oxoisovalerate dehydrogenase E1 component
VLTSDAVERGSYLATMATTIQRLGFDLLDAPVVTVGARNWITPSLEFEHIYFPHPDTILDAIHRELMPLRDYQPSGHRDLLDENLAGV